MHPHPKAPVVISPTSCAVRTRTGDGVSVGRCWYHCPDGICPLHGDVKQVLEPITSGEETGHG